MAFDILPLLDPAILIGMGSLLFSFTFSVFSLARAVVRNRKKA